jgi:hypothetical protein
MAVLAVSGAAVATPENATRTANTVASRTNGELRAMRDIGIVSPEYIRLCRAGSPSCPAGYFFFDGVDFFAFGFVYVV